MRKRHIVVLSEEERARLHTMIGRGVAPASALAHARILLKANQGQAGPGWTDAAIGGALEVNPATVARVRMRYVAAGLDAAVYRKAPARQYRRRVDGAGGPPGRAGMQRAAPGPQALDVAAAGRSAGGAGGDRGGVVRDGAAGLEANRLKPWLTQRWCIPPEQDAQFCWRMEDVLEVYTRPMTRAARRSAWTRPAASCSARSTRPSRSRRACQPARIMSTSAVGSATCSWCASRLPAGATSWSATGAPASTGRTASRTWSTSTTPMLSRLCWCKTTSTPTRPRRCTRRSSPPRPNGWPEAGAALHAQARQLAQHGRDRTCRAGHPVPGLPPARLGDPRAEVTAWQAARTTLAGVDWRFR